ncbi:hypothetical protein MHF_1292 [Mycoplasma haemofelis Ohio2]|uniref:Uncharacterized protein n=1 Tax=Mycoplasma haemofelis (strain Ohio2) TaxID=859194 RepID=F6FFW0_MYCHI|nr:hypothetical protein MHF_1292 [Mycoplasma haemofelis Ohio2]
MAVPTAKLLKVGGPILTGIGGVIATSSLVSKSAEEKQEETFKTKALTDEDPTIEEYKDQNESEQESQDQEEGPEGQDNPDSSEAQEASEQQGDGGQPPSGGSPDDQKSEAGSEASQAGQTEGGPDQADTTSGTGEPPQVQGTDTDNVDGKDGEAGDPSGVSEASRLEGDSSQEGGTSSDGESSGDGVTQDGSDTATYNHASGTKYGTNDVGMTRQDLERTIQMKSGLEDCLKQLQSIQG